MTQTRIVKVLPFLLVGFLGFQLRNLSGLLLAKTQRTGLAKYCPEALERIHHPIPTILISRGRSGSTSTWQIMSNLTGEETLEINEVA